MQKYSLVQTIFNACQIFLCLLVPLGRYCRIKKIEYIPSNLSGHWELPYILIGTSEKSIEISKTDRCSPLYFELLEQPWSFSFEKWGVPGRFNDPDGSSLAHGVIHKTRDDVSGVDVLMVMGHGSKGSRTAAYFFEKNVHLLGQLFGSDPFVILLRTESLLEKGEVVHFFPKPILWRRIVFFWTWRRFSKSSHIGLTEP